MKNSRVPTHVIGKVIRLLQHYLSPSSRMIPLLVHMTILGEIHFYSAFGRGVELSTTTYKFPVSKEKLVGNSEFKH